MHLFSLSLDRSILDTQSRTALRTRAYGTLVDTYTVVVPTTQVASASLAEGIVAYGSGGKNKLTQLIRMYRILCSRMQGCADVVLTTQEPSVLGFLGYLLARRFRVGLEIQVHGMEQPTRLRLLLAQYVLRRASVVRVVSERLKMWVHETCGVALDRIHVVSVYVDPEPLGIGGTLSAPLQKELASYSRAFLEQYKGTFNFVYIGRLVPVKNITLQIRAIAELQDDFPLTRLHIVGEGTEQGALEELVTQLGLTRRVNFHPFQPGLALNPFFTQTDCLLLTSFSEGWGLVVIEAMHAGLPVIMTDVGCAGEVVKTEENGIVIPSNDFEALCVAMRRIMVDSALRQKLSTEAHRTAKTLPTLTDTLCAYMTVWKIALRYPL
ncbi:glycosyltransferase family 4 protein [Candidatus Kaiserbacteria bacterium]|nr:glycosyltransferase family 4 protein [Candidatus Kaiserbacteria bacterium]